jgi:hypothetical protein
MGVLGSPPLAGCLTGFAKESAIENLAGREATTMYLFAFWGNIQGLAQKNAPEDAFFYPSARNNSLDESDE